MSDDYQVSPQAYLERCREQLIAGSKQGLFYAALELRCCVEARMAEYYEHYEPLRRKKFRPYRIAENQREIIKITRGDQITQVTFRFQDGTEVKQFHTPVVSELKKAVEQTADELRHSQRYRCQNDPWWHLTREKLLHSYRLAWLACRGEMPIPPLWNSATGEIYPLIHSATEGNQEAIGRLNQPAGTTIVIGIEHLLAPPKEWMCDL